MNFSDRRGGIATYSYQVVHSELDYLLLNHARSQGVVCFEGREITAIMFNEQGRPCQASWVEYKKGSQATS